MKAQRKGNICRPQVAQLAWDNMVPLVARVDPHLGIMDLVVQEPHKHMEQELELEWEVQLVIHQEWVDQEWVDMQEQVWVDMQEQEWVDMQEQEWVDMQEQEWMDMHH